MNTFLRGFFSSAGSGLLMSGIFYGMTYGASLLGLVAFNFAAVLPVAGIMIGAIGIFGGIMAVSRAHSAAHSAATVSRDVSTEPTIAPVLVPSVGISASMDRAEEAEAAPPGSWRQKVGAGPQNRVAQILNDTSLSDKSRASALLAEREATASTASQRS